VNGQVNGRPSGSDHEDDLWPADEHVALISVAVTGEAAQAALDAHLTPLVEDRVASRVTAQDATLWGPEAEEESA
jgi:glucose-6-phosphate isomerase